MLQTPLAKLSTVANAEHGSLPKDLAGDHNNLAGYPARLHLVSQHFPRDREGAILPERREQESHWNPDSTRQSLPAITIRKVVSMGDG